MASLLSFLGKTAKRVGNTINNDVIQPVNRDVIHGPSLGQVASPIINRVQNFPVIHPLLQADLSTLNTAKQIASILPNEARSVTGFLTGNQQAGINAFNQAGQGLNQVKDIAQSIPRGIVQLEQSVRPGGIRQPVIGTNPLTRGLLGNNPINSIQAEYSTNRNAGASKTNALTQAGLSGFGDVGSLLTAAGIGIKAGKAVAPYVKAADEAAFTPRASLHDQQVLSAYKEHLNGTNTLGGQAASDLITQARQVADKHGINLTTGTPKDRIQEADRVLTQLGTEQQNIAQGGYAKLPGKEPTPLQPGVSPENNSTPSGGGVKVGKGSDKLTDEAQRYANTFGISPDQAAKELAQTKAQTQAITNRQVKEPTGPISNKTKTQLNPPPSQAERLKLGNPEKNPLYGKVNLPAAHDAAQAHFNADFVIQHEKGIGQNALTDLGKLSAKDQDLMRSVQTKGPSVATQAENPAQFKQALGSIRRYYDTRHAYDHALGIETPYRENYLRDIVERNPSDALPLSGGNKTPGYTQAKTQPGYSNVAEALQRDIRGSSFNHAKLTYAKGLDEAYPGQIQAGKPYTDATTQLQTPFGNELFTNKDLAKQINDRAPVPKATGLTGKYDSVNAFLKYAKLSGGAFHAFTETGNFIGQQLASGKLFTEPGSTGKVFKVLFSDKAFKGEVQQLVENGTMDKAKLGGLTWAPSDIKADVNITPGGKIAKYTGIKSLHDATFKRDIPYAKLKEFEQNTQGLDPNVPADLAKIRQTAKAINENYGGINRIADGLTPKQARVTSRFLLATDFTEGKIRTLTAALTKGGPEGKLARQVVAGKALLFAGLATAGATLGGEYKDKTPTEIAENILGNFVNPTFKAGKSVVSFPATHISEFGKPLTPVFKNSNDRFSGIKQYTSNRLAAVPSEVSQLINNRDYSGQHIYGKETKKSGGAPISPAKTTVNIAKGVLPIPASQGLNTAQGGQSIPSAIGNIIGLKVRPDTSNSPQAQKAQVKQTIANLDKNPPKGYTLQQLDDGRYAYTLDGGRPQLTSDLNRAKRAIAEDTFAKSGQSYKVVGQTVYRKDSSGKVTPMTKTAFDYKIGSATLVAQKNSGDLNGWLNTANSQLQSIQKQLQDPSIDPLDALTLQNEADKIITDSQKYQGYGGFTKPKAAKKATAAITSFKTASTKGPAAPRGVSVRKLAAPKAGAVRKLSVSKIPASYKGRKIA